MKYSMRFFLPGIAIALAGLSIIGIGLPRSWADGADAPPAKVGEISLAPLGALTAADSPFVSGDNLVFLGDSITHNASGPNGFITLFDAAFARRTDLHVTVCNAGVPGHQVPDLQERLVRDVIELEPSVVFIYIGINDVWHWDNGRGTTVKDYEAGLRDIIGRLQERGIVVVLATPSVIGEKRHNRDDKMLDQYADISRKVAHDMDVDVCDLHKAFKDWLSAHNPQDLEKGVLTVDGVHLSDAGNALVAIEASRSLIAALRRHALTPVIPSWDFIAQRDTPVLLHQPHLPAGLTLHYTLDGSEPTLASPVYQSPLHLIATTTIAARTFVGADPASPVVKVTDHLIIPEPAVQVDVKPGIIRKYYENAWDKAKLPVKVPDLAALQPIETTVVPTVEVPAAPRSQDFALLFDGYFNVKETGIYGFRIGGNHMDLWLDGKRICYCNDAGESNKDFIVQVALEKGLHPIQVRLAQEWSGGKGVYLEVRPPHFVDVHVPRAEELFHKAQ